MNNPPMAGRPGPVQLLNGEIRTQGGLWRRLLARIVDGLLIGIPLSIVFAIIGDNIWENSISSAIVTGVVGVGYEGWMISFRGQTVGKIVSGVQVVKISDGDIPDLTIAVRRWFLYGGAGFLASLLSVGDNDLLQGLSAIPGLFALLVFLSPLFDGQRLGWHDRFADTAVIKVGPGSLSASSGDTQMETVAS